MKHHLVMRWAQPEIGIPGAALAHIEQSIPRVRQNLTRVAEAKLQFLPGGEWSGEHHRHQIVPFALQLRAFDGRVLDKVYGPSVGFDCIDLEKPRQFKQQRPFSSVANLERSE